MAQAAEILTELGRPTGLVSVIRLAETLTAFVRRPEEAGGTVTPPEGAASQEPRQEPRAGDPRKEAAVYACAVRMGLEPDALLSNVREQLATWDRLERRYRETLSPVDLARFNPDPPPLFDLLDYLSRLPPAWRDAVRTFLVQG